MLQLVTGRAGSGKSAYCLQRIEQLARDGRDALLVVPEQSSFSFERLLTLRLGPQLSGHVEVKSFRSLCADIFTECGGGARKRAGDAVRCALVRRAVTLLGDDIACFQRHRRDMSFFALTATVIEELKNAGVSPAFLSEIAGESNSALSAQKLREVASIYNVYDTLLAMRYHDNASETTAAAQLCARSRQFDGKTLFFDGFTGFTEPQFTMLKNLMQRVGEVCVTLSCDDIYAARYDAFVTVRKNGRHLLTLAEQNGVDAAPIIQLKDAPRFEVAGLSALERFLADEPVPEDSGSEGVYAITGDDRYGELDAVADEIVTLVREQDYRYSDIVVVARDINPYRAAVERTFDAYGIPYFCDANRDMLYSPITVFTAAALDLAGGLSSDGVLRLLKTGLTRLHTDTVAELENYLYVWNIERGGWHKPFDQNPAGFGASPPDTALTARLEQARLDVLHWTQPLRDADEYDAGTLVQAVFETLKRCGALAVLETLDEDSARQASTALEMLDSLYTVVAGEVLTPAEVRDLALQMAASTALGDIPPTLDQVSVGTADRMRADNPRAVFAIGLNDGVFPHTAFDSPLLTDTERDLLARNGADLTRSFENSAAMEQLYLYRALTCAARRVYLCRAKHDTGGAGLRPTPRVQAFIDRYGAAPPDSASDAGRFIVNERTAAYRYADALATGDDTALSSIAASNCGSVADTVTQAAQAPAFSLERRDLARQLLGDDTTISATRVEDFSKCRFRYFLERMLRIRPVKKAEISPVEAGNFVHGVLEQALRTLGGDIADTEKEQLAAVVAEASEQYIEESLGAAAMTQPRIRYLTERLKAQTLRLLLQLRDEQAQSEFRPVDFELSIGEGGDIAPLMLTTPDGHRVAVQGKVDRVDLLRRDGKSYIRVVDYKTGNKEFDLNDVYNGLSVQMFLYLFTVVQNGGARYTEPVPAAVMYVPADPSPVSDRAGDVEAEAKKAYRMDGIVLDDPAVIEAMERDVAGIYIPVERDKKSGGYKTANLASLEKLGRIRSHIEGLVVDMARTLYDGDIEAQPYVKPNGESACDYCDYAAVCRHDRSGQERPLEKRKPDELFAEGGGAQ